MQKAEEIRIALAPETLARLMMERRVSAEEFRCLDGAAKSRVKAIVLDNVQALMKNLARES